MTTFSGNFALFFQNIFLQNISKKKGATFHKNVNSTFEEHIIHDDVFGELCAFFLNIFLRNIVIALSRNRSISVPTKCAQTPVFFKVPTVAVSCSFLHKVAHHIAYFHFTNCATH